jgi:hypothetical protein
LISLLLLLLLARALDLALACPGSLYLSALAFALSLTRTILSRKVFFFSLLVCERDRAPARFLSLSGSL